MADKSDDLIISMATEMAALRRSFSRIESEVTGFSSRVNRRFYSMGRQIDRAFENVGRNMMRNLTGPLAGIGGVFATREVMRYADAWTEAGNKVAASGAVVGVAGRSLEEIRQIADDTRATFDDTVQLYSRMLRSAGKVAQSELEIAKATEIVNKAFKAGGAAASEMSAGILQLSQGLSSGLLAGDELRSVRENAPLLAQAIADYFGTTIGGLKDLGAEGKLTSEAVFKAILSAGPRIEAAFATTNATIHDSITRVQNALVQYIGSADQSMGATVALSTGLNALADDFDKFADAGLKLAAILAGALVGRSIVPMVAALGTAGKGVLGFVRLLSGAAAASGSTAAALKALTSAAGPLAAIIGGGVFLGLQHMVSENARIEGSIQSISARMKELGLSSDDAALRLRKVVEQTDALAEAERKLRIQQASGNLAALTGGTWGRNLADAASGTSSSTFAVIARAQAGYMDLFSFFVSEADKAGYRAVEALARAIEEGLPAEEIQSGFQEIAEMDISEPVLELAEELASIYRLIDENRKSILIDDYTSAENVAALRQQLLGALEARRAFEDMRWNNQEFVGDLDDLIGKLRENEISAEDAGAEIRRLAGMNPRFEGHLAGLQALIDQLIAATAEASALNAELGHTASGPAGNAALERYKYSRSDSAAPMIAGQAYLSELDRLNGLTKDQRDLEDEIAKIRKDMPEGAWADADEIERIARANLAWREANKKSGGGGKSDAEQFRERLDNEREAANLLQLQASYMATLNPLAANYENTLEGWRKEQELLNEARKAGLADDPAVIEGIEKIIETWRAGQEAIDAVREAQDEARQSMEDWFDLAKSATRSFIDDLIDGKTAAEALGNALQQLGNHLINLGLNSLFGTGQGSNPFGLVGQMFGFASGGYTGAGGKYQPAGVVHKGEYVFSKQATQRAGVGNLEALHRSLQGFADGGLVGVPSVPSIPAISSGANNNQSASFTFAPVIDARGADVAAVARLEQVVQRQQAEFEGRVKQIVKGRGHKWR